MAETKATPPVPATHDPVVAWLLEPDALDNIIAQGAGPLAEAFVLEADMTLTYAPSLQGKRSGHLVTELCDSMAEVAAIVGLKESELVIAAPPVPSAMCEGKMEYGSSVVLTPAEMETAITCLGDLVNLEPDAYSGYHCLRYVTSMDIMHADNEAYVFEDLCGDPDYPDDAQRVTRYRTVAEAIAHLQDAADRQN